MALEAVVSVVIQKLTDMLVEESIIFDEEIDQVEDIRIGLRRMRGFLIDAEKKQETDFAVKNWVRKYLQTLYGMEDIIETFVLQIARRRRSENLFRNRFPALRDHKARGCLREKMEKIRDEVKALEDSRPKFVQDTSFKLTVSAPRSAEGGLPFQRRISGGRREDAEKELPDFSRTVDIVSGSQPHLPIERYDGGAGSSCNDNGATLYEKPGTTESISPEPSFKDEFRLPQPKPKPIADYYVEESNIIGFEKDIELVTQLIRGGDDHRRRVISVVGAEGSGKTTLVRTIFNGRDIKRHFKYRAWIFVGENYSIKDLLRKILKQAKQKEQGVLNEAQLAAKLSECLNKGSYLLVMDDVRTRQVWECLKTALPEFALGRIVFTTSPVDQREDEHLDSFADHRHELSSLSEKDSWRLFMDMAGFGATKNFQDSDIFTLRPRILEVCKGLPLNISLLGGLLLTKKSSYDEWSRVLETIQSQRVDILSLSYNDLPFHSKLCLLYVCLFPKEFDIPVRRLYRLLVAEGFVKRSLGMSPEDLVDEYLKDLIHRNMIQLSKLRSDRSLKKCRMPGALHDRLLSKAQDISLFCVHRCASRDVAVVPMPPPPVSSVPPLMRPRRIVEFADIKSCSSELSLEHLRSYLSFNVQNKDIPAKEVKNFLGKIIGNRGFGLLRVLDLEGVYKPSLPDTLGNFFHLRYLGLRWTFLDSLPSSVGKLPYLETLDMKHTNINSIPSSIWKLKHLRHLNLNDTRLDMPSSLTRLQTLWGLIVDRDDALKNGLNKLTDLRELGITYRLSCGREFSSWIADLTALQSLRLRSKNEKGRPSRLTLNPLSRLKQLSHLYLLGHLQSLPEKHEFPPNLKVLTLSISVLKEDPMKILGRLPSLNVLRLFADSYMGQEMVCHLGSFDKLRVLKLWMLKNLETWEVKDGAMQSLQKLEIRGCKKLKELPPQVLKLETLEDLILTGMPDDFVNQVQTLKPQHISLTDNSDWKFTPLPWAGPDEVSGES